MIINIKAVDEQNLMLGDAFICKLHKRDSEVIRFVGYDPEIDKVIILNESFDVVNRYENVSEIAEHYTIKKIIKNNKLIISEVKEDE